MPVKKEPECGTLGLFLFRCDYCASLMAACAAANVLRAMFKIIPKCRSGVPESFIYPYWARFAFRKLRVLAQFKRNVVS